MPAMANSRVVTTWPWPRSLITPNTDIGATGCSTITPYRMRSHRVNARLRCAGDEDLAGSVEDIRKRQYTLLHSDTIDSLNFRLSVVFVSVAVTQAGSFQQEVAHTYTTQDGLPSDDVVSVNVVNGRVFAITSAGVAQFAQGRWSRETVQLPVRSNLEVTDSRGRAWSVRAGAVIAPYTPTDGLPYDKITSIVAAEDGVIWLATPKGAIRFDGKTWEYRQGLRWLPDDDVRAIAVEPNGNAWFATAHGVGLIERRLGTLQRKAAFFEEEIDQRHRRTPL